MSNLQLKLASALASPQLGKAGPAPDMGGALYAAYLLGGGWDPEGLKTGVHDWSGNGRNLIKTGADGAQGEQTRYYITNQTHYLDTPFTGDALAAANGAATIVMLHKVPAANNVVLITNGPPVAGGRVLSISAAANLAVAAQEQENGVLVNASIPSDAARGTMWEVVAGVYRADRVTTWRYLPTGARPAFRNLPATFAAIGGDKTLRIGNNKSASLTATGSMSAVWFYDEALSTPRVATVARAMLALAAVGGLP